MGSRHRVLKKLYIEDLAGSKTLGESLGRLLQEAARSDGRTHGVMSSEAKAENEKKNLVRLNGHIHWHIDKPESRNIDAIKETDVQRRERHQLLRKMLNVFGISLDDISEEQRYALLSLKPKWLADSIRYAYNSKLD